MSLLPDRFTAQCPGRADADKPVLLRVAEKKPDIDEECPDEERKCEVRADLVTRCSRV